MSEEKYKFPRQWQSKLLSLLITNGAQIVSEGLVKAEYFERPSHVSIATVVLGLYEKYGVPLTFNAVKEALREAASEEEFPKVSKSLKQLHRSLKEIEEKLIVDQVKRFASHQAIKSAAREAMTLLDDDNVEEIDKVWTTALQVGKGSGVGEERLYFSSFNERNKKRNEKPEVLHTLIKPLDEILADGGFGRKELNVFLGLPSGGKSFALDHIAKAAIIQKKKVIFYTLEMSWDKVASRLDASFAGVELRDLRNQTSKVHKKLERLKRQFGDTLIIKEYPASFASVSTIRNHIINTKMTGFNPHVIIVDYINLLKRDDSFDSTYKGLGDVYIQLRSLIQEFDIWGVTAAQSNRAGFDAELITMKDIGESFEGAMHSDVIITVNRTEEEKQNEMMRLYMAKNRNELDSITLKIHTNFKKGSFYRRG